MYLQFTQWPAVALCVAMPAVVADQHHPGENQLGLAVMLTIAVQSFTWH